MSGEKSEYVTKDQLEIRLNAVDDKIDRIDRAHERNFNELKATFQVMNVTFSKLNDNIEEMVDSQKQTNKELRDISIKTIDHDHRITSTEERQDKLEKDKKEYMSDVLKIVGIVISGLITLTGGIITAALKLM